MFENKNETHTDLVADKAKELSLADKIKLSADNGVITKEEMKIIFENYENEKSDITNETSAQLDKIAIDSAKEMLENGFSVKSEKDVVILEKMLKATQTNNATGEIISKLMNQFSGVISSESKIVVSLGSKGLEIHKGGMFDGNRTSDDDKVSVDLEYKETPVGRTFNTLKIDSSKYSKELSNNDIIIKDKQTGETMYSVTLDPKTASIRDEKVFNDTKNYNYNWSKNGEYKIDIVAKGEKDGNYSR